MKLVRLMLLIILFNAVVNFSSAQYHAMGTEYTISFPTGKTKAFIDKTSFRGFTLDYRFHFNDKWAVGASAGLYTFNEQLDHGTYEHSDGRSTLSGEQFRYVNSLPLLVVSDYYHSLGKERYLFAGVGVGSTYNRKDWRMGLYGDRIKAWQFSVAPEIGFKAEIDNDVYGYISMRQNFSFEKGDLESQSYFSLNIGLMYQ